MKVRKRIELEKIKTFKNEIQIENSDENEGNLDNNDGNPDITTETPDCGVEFMLEGETLAGHGPQSAATIIDENGKLHSNMGGWPEVEVAFTVAESDIARVNAWFDDNYHGVSAPESALLQKNRTAAVHNALKTYFSAAHSSNLFTSPFRIGWRYRYSDNSLSEMHDCGSLDCFHTAPRLPVTTHQLTDKYLHTRAQIRNVPARLNYRFKSSPDFSGIRNKISAVEVYITKQASLYAPEAEVTGIRSITIDGSPRRCWHYERYAENDIGLLISQDNDFRRIAVIAIDEIEENDEFSPLPIAPGALTDFSKLPKPDSTTSEEPSMTGKKIKLLTEPLHLDYPEDEKSVRCVTLRGVFQRETVKLRLYASQHRENRHLIASTTGPYLYGIYGSKWRWFEIEIEATMREGDFFEAVTFEFNV